MHNLKELTVEELKFLQKIEVSLITLLKMLIIKVLLVQLRFQLEVTVDRCLTSLLVTLVVV